MRAARGNEAERRDGETFERVFVTPDDDHAFCVGRGEDLHERTVGRIAPGPRRAESAGPAAPDLATHESRSHGGQIFARQETPVHAASDVEKLARKRMIPKGGRASPGESFEHF